MSSTSRDRQHNVVSAALCIDQDKTGRDTQKNSERSKKEENQTKSKLLVIRGPIVMEHFNESYYTNL